MLNDTVLGCDVWCLKQIRKATTNCMVWILPERRYNFRARILSTQKAGRLFRTLLSYLNCYLYWVGSEQIFWTSKLPKSKD